MSFGTARLSGTAGHHGAIQAAIGVAVAAVTVAEVDNEGDDEDNAVGRGVVVVVVVVVAVVAAAAAAAVVDYHDEEDDVVVAASAFVGTTAVNGEVAAVTVLATEAVLQDLPGTAVRAVALLRQTRTSALLGLGCLCWGVFL